MIPTDDNLPTIDPTLLDQLVDGELSEAKRRELLLLLERTPGGWRHCAMAFLEAQCFQDALGMVVPPPAPPSTPRNPRQRRLLHIAGTLLAMAASLALAFGAGTLFRNSWRTLGSHALAPREFAAKAPGSSAASPSREEGLAKTSPRQPAPGPAATPWDSRNLVTVSLPERFGGGSIRLPVTEVDRFEESWLHGNPQAMSDSLRELLERVGCEVRETRQLVPASMQDGRQLVVPMDQVEVRYVGNPRYQ